MATTGTPFGMFWLDGFRTPDGKVRQYVISAEKMRSVAAQVMEKRGEDSEDRVFAIGVAFYLSKDKKPEMPKSERTEPQKTLGFIGHASFNKPMFFSPQHTPQSWGGNRVSNSGGLKKKGFAGSGKTYGSPTGSSLGSCTSGSLGSCTNAENKTRGGTPIRATSSGDMEISSLADAMVEPIRRSVEYDAGDGDNLYGCDIDLDMGIVTPDSATDEIVETVTPVKKLEVGAGALVSQRIYDDPKNLKKYWEETPAGMIYINYCDVETLKKILDGGKKATKKDGFMDEIQVG